MVVGVSNRKSFFNAVICVFLKMITLKVATSLVEIKSWKEKEKQEFAEDSPSSVSSPRSSPSPGPPTSAPSPRAPPSMGHAVEPLFLLLLPLPTTLSSYLCVDRSQETKVLGMDPASSLLVSLFPCWFTCRYTSSG